MEFQHVCVKVFVDGEMPVDPERFIELFQRWIREAPFDELLIDVADYRHVPDGPGVMLIGHEADYSIDYIGGRCGLLYNRKDSLDGSNADRFAQALASAGKACKMLEEEFSGEGLKFSRQEFELLINDRALAPNSDETAAALESELKSFLSSALGSGDLALARYSDDPRARLGLCVRAGQPIDLVETFAAAR